MGKENEPSGFNMVTACDLGKEGQHLTEGC